MEESVKPTNKNIRTAQLSVFLIVFFSNDTTLFGTNMNQAFVALGFKLEAIIMLGIVAVYTVNHGYLISLNKRMAVIWSIFVLGVLATSCINQDFRGGYVTLILMAAVGAFTTKCISLIAFSRAYVNVFKFFAICSILGRVITDVVPSLRYVGLHVQRSTGQVFYHYILYARSIEQIGGNRNYGIFREPGVFQAYLIIAIIICIILFDKRNYKKEIIGIAVLVLATMMTKSTTAYIELILVWLFFSIKGNRHAKGKEKTVILVTEMVVVTLLICYLCMYSFGAGPSIVKRVFLDKFDSSSESYASGFTRMASIGANIRLWLKNPLFGVGITNKSQAYNDLVYSLYGNSVDSDTNTVLATFSQFGCLVGMIIVVGVFGLTCIIGNRRKERLIALIMVLVLLSTEYFLFSALFNVWLWYGLRNGIGKRKCGDTEETSYEYLDKRLLHIV